MMYELDASLHHTKKPRYRLDNVKAHEVRFRVPRWMKEDFMLYCEVRDIPASHLLRGFIRKLLQEEINK